MIPEAAAVVVTVTEVVPVVAPVAELAVAVQVAAELVAAELVVIQDKPLLQNHKSHDRAILGRPIFLHIIFLLILLI